MAVKQLPTMQIPYIWELFTNEAKEHYVASLSTIKKTAIKRQKESDSFEKLQPLRSLLFIFTQFVSNLQVLQGLLAPSLHI